MALSSEAQLPGASHSCGGSRLAVNPCLRWLESSAGSEGNGQAAGASGQGPVAGKVKGSIQEFARISTKHCNCSDRWPGTAGGDARLGTRTYGRIGAERVGDRLEWRTQDCGATGRWLRRATLESTPGGGWRGVRGALRGESPRTREGRYCRGQGLGVWGGRKLRGAVSDGRRRERRGTRTHGGTGTRFVGDAMEWRTHGGRRRAAGCAGLHWNPHPAACGGVSGGRCGGSPPAQGRAAGPTVQKDAGNHILQLCRRMEHGPVMIRLLHEV